MGEKTRKRRRILKREEIEKKKDLLEQKIEEKIEENRRKISPKKSFLIGIQDEVRKAINQGISYKQLSKIIFEVYKFKVSETTLRDFSHSYLNIPKKTATTKKEEKETEEDFFADIDDEEDEEDNM